MLGRENRIVLKVLLQNDIINGNCCMGEREMSMSRKCRTLFVLLLICFSVEGCLPKQESAREYCVINGKTMSFMPEKEKEALREPLEKLLASERKDFFDDALSEEKEEPGIPANVACGLFDVTGDGTPELLVLPTGYGGSSGMVKYYVYDCFTGEKLGEISGGYGESWCMYYFAETEELRAVGFYWHSGGTYDRYRMLSFLNYDAVKNTCAEEQYLYVHVATQEDFYTEYEVRGEKADADTYYLETDWFNTNGIRIPETELQMLYWSDVCAEEDRFVRAEKMAEALLSLSQKFIVTVNKRRIT